MIAKKTWREILPMAIAYLCVLELLLVPEILLWPKLKESLPAVLTLLKIIPGDWAQRMSGVVTNYSGYMAVRLFFQGVNIVGLAIAVLLGTGLIARERENQTLEFLLARPISRPHILWSKVWVTAVCLTLPIFVTTWSTIPISWAIGETLPFWPLTWASLYSSLFVLMFLMLTVAVSVVCRTQVHVAFLVGAFVVIQVSVFFTQKIRGFSVFRFSDFTIYYDVLEHRLSALDLLLGEGLLLLGASVALYALADRLFRRIDL